MERKQRADSNGYQRDGELWKPSTQSRFGFVVVHTLVGGGCGGRRHCRSSGTPVSRKNKEQVLAVICEIDDWEAVPPVVVVVWFGCCPDACLGGWWSW